MGEARRPRLRVAFANSIQMFAGGEVWMLSAMTALSDRGHDVTLICRPDTELERRARRAEIVTECVRFRGDVDPVTILDLVRIFRRRAVEVVLTNMDKELRLCGLAARLAGVPVVLPRRGIDYPLKDTWRYRFAYNILATRVIANSQATKQALLRHAPWLDPERVDVVYNGIDLRDALTGGDGALRRELGFSEDTLLLGFVGQLDERKGIDDLLSAFNTVRQQVPRACLVVAGAGPLESEIRRFCSDRGISDSLRMLGFRDDGRAVMQAIDVLVLPSRWEGFGIVLIEAMAAGKPVVATGVSSIPEIVADGETGYLVPPRRPELLAERLVRVLTNQKLADRLGRQGKARVAELFTLDGMVERMERIFIDSLRQRQGRLT